MFQLKQPSRVCARALIVCAAAPVPDRGTVCGIVCVDLALLTHAINSLRCAPSAGALRGALDALDDHGLRELVLLLVEPAAHQHDPISADDWHARHRVGAVAEAIAEARPDDIGLSPSDARLRSLLDLAGGGSPHGERLGDVGRYRNHAVEDLVDAHAGLRVAITLAAPPQQRMEYAHALFGMDNAAWVQVEQRAQQIAEERLSQLGLPTNWSEAEESSACSELAALTPRLRIVGFWVAQRDLDGDQYAARLVDLVEVALQVPAALYALGANADVLTARRGVLAELPISRGNVRSKIAAGITANSLQTITRWETTAVIDQQVMSALGCEGLCITPVVCGRQTLGVLVTGVPRVLGPDQINIVMAWYGATLGHLLARRASAEDAVDQVSGLVRADYQHLLREAVHEANNPLAIVHNYLHIVLNRVAEDSSLREPLLIAMQEIDRTAAILQQLVIGDGPRRVRSQGAHLPSVVADIARLFQATFQASWATRAVAFDLQIEHDMAATIQHADEVRQILMNLLRNAAEAIDEGGRVRVICRGNVFRNGLPQAVVSVTDNAAGIPLSTLRALLEPKATTKGAGHVGVGLALAHRLAAQIGASLDCESGPSGTTFTLMLNLTN